MTTFDTDKESQLPSNEEDKSLPQILEDYFDGEVLQYQIYADKQLAEHVVGSNQQVVNEQTKTAIEDQDLKPLDEDYSKLKYVFDEEYLPDNIDLSFSPEYKLNGAHFVRRSGPSKILHKTKLIPYKKVVQEHINAHYALASKNIEESAGFYLGKVDSFDRLSKESVYEFFVKKKLFLKKLLFNRMVFLNKHFAGKYIASIYEQESIKSESFLEGDFKELLSIPRLNAFGSLLEKNYKKYSPETSKSDDPARNEEIFNSLNNFSDDFFKELFDDFFSGFSENPADITPGFSPKQLSFLKNMPISDLRKLFLSYKYQRNRLFEMRQSKDGSRSIVYFKKPKLFPEIESILSKHDLHKNVFESELWGACTGASKNEDLNIFLKNIRLEIMDEILEGDLEKNTLSKLEIELILKKIEERIPEVIFSEFLKYSKKQGAEMGEILEEHNVKKGSFMRFLRTTKHPLDKKISDALKKLKLYKRERKKIAFAVFQKRFDQLDTSKSVFARKTENNHLILEKVHEIYFGKRTYEVSDDTNVLLKKAEKSVFRRMIGQSNYSIALPDRIKNSFRAIKKSLAEESFKRLSGESKEWADDEDYTRYRERIFNEMKKETFSRVFRRLFSKINHVKFKEKLFKKKNSTYRFSDNSLKEVFCDLIDQKLFNNRISAQVYKDMKAGNLRALFLNFLNKAKLRKTKGFSNKSLSDPEAKHNKDDEWSKVFRKRASLDNNTDYKDLQAYKNNLDLFNIEKEDVDLASYKVFAQLVWDFPFPEVLDRKQILESETSFLSRVMKEANFFLVDSEGSSGSGFVEKYFSAEAKENTEHQVREVFSNELVFKDRDVLKPFCKNKEDEAVVSKARAIAFDKYFFYVISENNEVSMIEASGVYRRFFGNRETNDVSLDFSQGERFDGNIKKILNDLGMKGGSVNPEVFKRFEQNNISLNFTQEGFEINAAYIDNKTIEALDFFCKFSGQIFPAKINKINIVSDKNESSSLNIKTRPDLMHHIKSKSQETRNKAMPSVEFHISLSELGSLSSFPKEYTVVLLERALSVLFRKMHDENKDLLERYRSVIGDKTMYDISYKLQNEGKFKGEFPILHRFFLQHSLLYVTGQKQKIPEQVSLFFEEYFGTGTMLSN